MAMASEEEETRCERWKHSTKALLYALSKETCQPHSIPVVPDDLRKSNESAYIPKVVSIGPRYKGRRELLQTEEIKWRCVTTLLSRTFGLDAIEGCMQKILELDAAVRASYVGEITLDKYDLATIMVFDGFFLLELIICESKYDSELPIPFNGISPGIQVKKMEYVLSDLLLPDNQIPIIILEMLLEKLGFSADGSSVPMRELIQNLVLSLFGFSGKLMVESSFHFLDIAYSYMKMGWNEKKKEENAIFIFIDTQLPMQYQHHQNLNLNLCATKLKAIGVTIQRLDISGNINFISATEFNIRERILKIPMLVIDPTTEALWRSFIAWEHHKKNGCLSGAAWHSICTSYALLFSDLICYPSDVQLLKDRQIIVDHSGKNNRDLMAFFHSIANGVDRPIIDPNHAAMFNALNRLPTANYATKIFVSLPLWCRDFQKFFKRGYNFAAAMITILTVVQACYAVVAYHYPKKE